jgi:hypothetical protein
MWGGASCHRSCGSLRAAEGVRVFETSCRRNTQPGWGAVMVVGLAVFDGMRVGWRVLRRARPGELGDGVAAAVVLVVGVT